MSSTRIKQSSRLCRFKSIQTISFISYDWHLITPLFISSYDMTFVCRLKHARTRSLTHLSLSEWIGLCTCPSSVPSENRTRASPTRREEKKEPTQNLEKPLTKTDWVHLLVEDKGWYGLGQDGPKPEGAETSEKSWERPRKEDKQRDREDPLKWVHLSYH